MSSGSTKICDPAANAPIAMYAIHFLIRGSLTRNAVCHAPAPSSFADSSTSSGIVASAPCITTIQLPAPLQKAMTAKTTGSFGDVSESPSEWEPSQFKPKLHGLVPGCSMNSQSITLAEPASPAGR